MTDLPSCLFCGSSRSQPAPFPRATLFGNSLFEYKQCLSCRLVYIHPLPNPLILEQMYSTAYHDQFYFDKKPQHAGIGWGQLSQWTDSRQILDFGCGDGSYLRHYANLGYSCTGVEFDPALVDRLREREPHMQFLSLHDFWENPEVLFSIVHLGDVLEHLVNPLEVLQKLHSRMSPGGILLAEGPLENNPNLALLARKLISRLRSHSPATHVPYHLTFSNATNQQALFQKAGFETLAMRVSETSWPYPANPTWRPVGLAQYLLGKMSISISQLFSFLRWGNRFCYIGKRNVSSSPHTTGVSG